MNGSYYFNVRLLRDHALELKEEKRMVQRLADAIRRARKESDPLLRQEYNRLIANCEELTRFFEKMIEAFENTADDADSVSREIGRILRDSTEALKMQNNNLMV